MEPSINLMVAEYLRSVASWRRQRYQDDLRDARNLRSAAALEDLAEHILALPADDERMQRLHGLAVQGEAFVPGQQTAYEIGRFRFFSDEAGLDAFVDRIVELAIADRGEHGRFGGVQVPGDEPWR
ncbi:MAG TPA: hypothetical protein VKB09_01745 [Thermomicrobiales bacterium]|nr:hypothetical protein [Thermomicrobiales bacterium]